MQPRKLIPLAGALLALVLLPVMLTAEKNSATVTLAELQALLGWRNCSVEKCHIELGDGKNRLRLYPGRRRSEFNGTAVWFNGVIEPANSEVVRLARDDVDNVILPLVQQPSRRSRNLRIMLDPGHGGEDGGATARFPPLVEKELMLDIALRVGKRLDAAGMTVCYTRTDDTYLSLTERSTLAAKWQADVFISLHANTAANTAANGCETYILPLAGYPSTAGDNSVAARARKGNGHNRNNLLLGYNIHRRLAGRGGADDRGLRRARFQVLREAPCPAVLIEVGFLSNPREARQLAGKWHREQLAARIAGGILRYARYE